MYRILLIMCQDNPEKIISHTTNYFILELLNFTEIDFSRLVSLHRASGEMNNDIVVEMKTEKSNEEAGLLNKRPSTEQVGQSDMRHSTFQRMSYINQSRQLKPNHKPKHKKRRAKHRKQEYRE